MNPHRTTDPVQRAADIADREEHELEVAALNRGESLESSLRDWPRHWLDTHQQVMWELSQ